MLYFSKLSSEASIGQNSGATIGFEKVNSKKRGTIVWVKVNVEDSRSYRWRQRSVRKVKFKALKLGLTESKDWQQETQNY